MSRSALSSVCTTARLALGLARSGLVSVSGCRSIVDWRGKGQSLDSVGRDGGLRAVSGRGSVGLLGGRRDVDGDSHGHSE